MSSNDREDSYNGQQLLRDIKEVSKALYLNNNAPQRPLLSLPPVRSRSLASVSSGQEATESGVLLLNKKKKSSVAWDWKKPLKAIAHLGQRRFDVCFHLHVHSIEGLPSNLDGTKLVVQWKRKDEVVSSTQPSSVSQGTAEFEETLTHRCSVYGSKHGPHRSARYDQKLFLVCVSPVDAPWLVLGKHWVDLARILPLSLEEMEGARRSTRKWNTSFKLSGVADSAVLNLGFDYSVVTSSVCDSASGSVMLKRVGSVPSMERRSSSPLDDGKFSHQLSPNLSLDLSRSVDLLYEKLSEQKPERSTGTDKQADDSDNNTGKGVEVYQETSRLEESTDPKTESSEIEVIDVHELLKDEDEDAAFLEETCFVDQLSLLELKSGGPKSAFSSHVEIQTSSAIDDSTEKEAKSSYKAAKILTKSRSLDDITESVANDFLNMLELEECSYVYTSDGEPTSPREYLLREFEKEALASGNCLLDLGGGAEYLSDIDEEPNEFSFSSSSLGETKREGKSQLLISRRNAKLLEDLETETLMREWDLDDNSLCVCSDGFGSPIELPVDEELDLPPLGDNIGPFVWTKGGGCIRSMSPLLFRKCKDASRLIMQVSVPVVLVPELGSDVLEILQSLAASGIEGLCSEINALMPLEDIMGKTIHEVIKDTSSDKSKVALVKKPSGQLDSFHLKEKLGGFGSNMCSGYVPLDALASLAIDGIESLSVEGLKIQCSMSDQDPPSVTAPKPIDQSAALELISFSLTLDEWLRLDHGTSDTGDQTGKHMREKNSAHHAYQASNGKGNTCGNKLALALRVLLRDPLRCYEPVGASMLALIHVERSLVSSNPLVCSSAQEETFDDDTHLWRITDIGLAGLKTEPGVDHPWCTKTQQESGSRWLLASGTGKTINCQASKSKAIIVSNPQATKKSLDTLWSITIDSRHNQEGGLSSSAAFVPLTRNSDVLFSDETTEGL